MKAVIQRVTSASVSVDGNEISKIGEGLFIHARSVTGAMRKLIADGYVEKTGQNPVSYSLTDTARSWKN